MAAAAAPHGRGRRGPAQTAGRALITGTRRDLDSAGRRR